MQLFLYILLIVSALLSGAAFLFFKKTNPVYLKLALSFSGAFLFAVTVIHLIPEAYLHGGQGIGIYILIGFLFQIILELFSEGIEHGHVHVHHHPHAAFPLSIMLGLCVHSFFEGMPLAQRNGEAWNSGLFAGIVLHHMPVAFALMSLLIASGLSKAKSLLNLFIFALMAPLGALASQFIASGLGANEVYFDRVMGVVIGIFLHISTTILFESSEQHRFNYYKMGAILAGVGLALASF